MKKNRRFKTKGGLEADNEVFKLKLEMDPRDCRFALSR